MSCHSLRLVATIANIFDKYLADGDIEKCRDYLDAMSTAIDELLPGTASHVDACQNWLSRLTKLANAQSSARASAYEPWDRWFAEALASQRRYNRELQFAFGVVNS